MATPSCIVHARESSSTSWPSLGRGRTAGRLPFTTMSASPTRMRPLSVTAERRADGTIIKKGWHLMRDKKSHPYHSAVAPLAILVLVSASTFLACDHGSDAVTPEKIEQQYGVSGA